MPDQLYLGQEEESALVWVWAEDLDLVEELVLEEVLEEIGSGVHALDAELRLYDYLFTKPDPYDVPEGGEFTDNLNPESLQVVMAKLESGLRGAEVHEPFQFMRQGYFCADEDSTPEKLIFNRTISLVDTWAKMAKEKGK